jgi:hypothetical protein
VGPTRVVSGPASRVEGPRDLTAWGTVDQLYLRPFLGRPWDGSDLALGNPPPVLRVSRRWSARLFLIKRQSLARKGAEPRRPSRRLIADSMCRSASIGPPAKTARARRLGCERDRIIGRLEVRGARLPVIACRGQPLTPSVILTTIDGPRPQGGPTRNPNAKSRGNRGEITAKSLGNQG